MQGSYFGKVGALEKGFEADLLVVDDSALNEGIDDIRKRVERFLYLSDEMFFGSQICIRRTNFIIERNEYGGWKEYCQSGCI